MVHKETSGQKPHARTAGQREGDTLHPGSLPPGFLTQRESSPESEPVLFVRYCDMQRNPVLTHLMSHLKHFKTKAEE